MRNRPLTTASCLVVLAGLGGCAMEDQAGDDGLGEVQQEAAICGKFGCGTNSPVIANYGLHELNTLGIFNAEGFSIVNAVHPSYAGRSFRVTVASASLSAKTMDGGPSVLLKNGSVKNLVLQIKGPGSTVYNVRISDVGTTPYWSSLYPGMSPAYQLDWKLAGDPDAYYTNVCSNPPATAEKEELLNMNPFWAVVFEGDRIDSTTKVVYGDGKTAASNTNWFNIGCAGHALAKAHLNRETMAGSPGPGITTTLTERTAFLKMIVGDYCGTGHPFTVAGEPLVWRDSRSWLSFYAPPTGIEARWSATGATCLESPRLLVSPNPQVPILFPDIELAIAAECARPPKCSVVEDTDVNKFFGKPFVSANH